MSEDSFFNLPPDQLPDQEPAAAAPASTGGFVEDSTPRWYIVHTYSGFEQRVQKSITEKMRTQEDRGLIKRCVVPTERVIEPTKSGAKRTATRKLYPGYVMVLMVMTEYSWNVIQNLPKVTGFVGGKNRPTPMNEKEASHILNLMEERRDTPRPKFSFEKGDSVRIDDGPFSGFTAVVDEVNYDKGKLRVSVSIFGRQTPLELDFVQVSKG